MKIIEWLDKKGITRTKFCKDLGVSRCYLHTMNRGKFKVGLNKAKEIVIYTNGEVTMRDLRPDVFEEII